jgi:hypothetical protein
MQTYELCTDIKNRHANGESYQIIADSLGITKAMCYQITQGYKPGKRVATILKLDPPPDLARTRARREQLNQIARASGYTSWTNFETHVLKKGEIKP